MDDNDRLSELLSEQIRIETEIERIKRSCKGNLSEKKIKGKTQTYLQWYENGKTNCKYVRKADLPELQDRLADRDRSLTLFEERLNSIQSELEILRGSAPSAGSCLRESSSLYRADVCKAGSYQTVSGIFDGLNIIPEEVLPLRKGTRVRIVYYADSVPDTPVSVLERYSGCLDFGTCSDTDSFLRKGRDDD